MKGMLDMFRNLAVFLWKRKAWWIAPIILLIIVVALLMVFGQSSAVSSFVYALF